LSFKPDPILSGFLTTTHCGASVRRLPARDPAGKPDVGKTMRECGRAGVRCAASESALKKVGMKADDKGSRQQTSRHPNPSMKA
jgi:hypothetical protein